MGLSRDEILGKRRGKVEEIKVPEWGGTVFVREITASERDAFEAGSLDKKGGARMDRIFEASMRLNRLTKDDVDELEKNSEDQAETPAA